MSSDPVSISISISNELVEVHLKDEIIQNPTYIEKALECPLCLSLICEPLSISCGHSFCRVCLVKSLRRSKKKCPQCRAVCHMSAEDAQENIMIKDLAMHTNSVEYAARLLESEVEKKTWSTLLPIFYYNETLFPGGRLDLHLFEPRYRVMMQRVVSSTRSFAYVPNFHQYSASIGDIALVALLEEVEFMADGRCTLQARLSSRMTISDHYIEEGTQGLHFCRLTPLSDDPMEEDQIPIVADLVNLATLIVGSFFTGPIRARLEARYGVAPPPSSGAAGAEAFSLWMAAICPLPESEKGRLLGSTDTAERLRTTVGCFSVLVRQTPVAVGHGVPADLEEDQEESVLRR